MWKTWVASIDGEAGEAWAAQPARMNANKIKRGRVIFIWIEEAAGLKCFNYTQ